MKSYGYVYVLKNRYIPDLTKIGYTERDPLTRAEELSNFTGVPGKWVLCKSWKLYDAYLWEQKIFAALANHRETGEFFRLLPVRAIDLINIYLKHAGAINDKDLSDVDLADIRRARIENSKFEEKYRRNAILSKWKRAEGDFERKSLKEAEDFCGRKFSDVVDEEKRSITIFDNAFNFLYAVTFWMWGPFYILARFFLNVERPSYKPSGFDQEKAKISIEKDKILERYRKQFFSENGFDSILTHDTLVPVEIAKITGLPISALPRAEAIREKADLSKLALIRRDKEILDMPEISGIDWRVCKDGGILFNKSTKEVLTIRSGLGYSVAEDYFILHNKAQTRKIKKSSVIQEVYAD